MGCGKSSVGRRLSELLCCPFMDLDTVIEQQTSRTIPEIFATEGEAAFRQIELETLRSIIKSSTAAGRIQKESLSSPMEFSVLSLGGGTVVTPKCAELVKENTVCIYLKASVDTLVERLTEEAASRPLLDSCLTAQTPESRKTALRERIETLMGKRAATYEETANHIIEIDGLSLDVIAQQIISIISQ